jgi:hypothetical protein
VPTQFSTVMLPQGMTLDQKIARARHVLGLHAADSAAEPSGSSGSSPWQPWALGAALVAAGVAAAVVVIRRIHAP